MNGVYSLCSSCKRSLQMFKYTQVLDSGDSIIIYRGYCDYCDTENEDMLYAGCVGYGCD